MKFLFFLFCCLILSNSFEFPSLKNVFHNSFESNSSIKSSKEPKLHFYHHFMDKNGVWKREELPIPEISNADFPPASINLATTTPFASGKSVALTTVRDQGSCGGFFF
jgi:hypothetical protein